MCGKFIHEKMAFRRCSSWWLHRQFGKSRWRQVQSHPKVSSLFSCHEEVLCPWNKKEDGNGFSHAVQTGTISVFILILIEDIKEKMYFIYQYQSQLIYWCPYLHELAFTNSTTCKTFSLFMSSLSVCLVCHKLECCGKNRADKNKQGVVFIFCMWCPQQVTTP